MYETSKLQTLISKCLGHAWGSNGQRATFSVQQTYL